MEYEKIQRGISSLVGWLTGRDHCGLIVLVSKEEEDDDTYHCMLDGSAKGQNLGVCEKQLSISRRVSLAAAISSLMFRGMIQIVSARLLPIVGDLVGQEGSILWTTGIWNFHARQSGGCVMK